MKYDDASWHFGGDFPKDLPNAAGATHIGMFVAWCLLNGMGGELHVEDFPEDIERLRARQATPGAWFIRACDSKFTDEDLNDEGNAFAAFYYAADNAEYLGDYEKAVGEGAITLYHVPDAWQVYDALAPIIERRYKAWQPQRDV